MSGPPLTPGLVGDVTYRFLYIWKPAYKRVAVTATGDFNAAQLLITKGAQVDLAPHVYARR